MMLHAAARPELRTTRTLVVTSRLSPVSMSMSAIRGAGRDLLIVPEVGCSLPVKRPSSVGFPLPLGPMMPRREPSKMENETASNKGVV